METLDGYRRAAAVLELVPDSGHMQSGLGSAPGLY